MSLDYLSKIVSICTEIIGLISIIVAVENYRNSRKQQNNLNYNNKLQLTLKVIKAFEANIIPEMEKAEGNISNRKIIQKYKIRFLNQIGIKKADASQISFKSLSKSNRHKIKDVVRFNSVIDVINDIEQWSIYTEKHMVYYKLVYREVHHDYLSFIHEFKDVLNDAKSYDDTYSACHYLYNRMKVSEKHENFNRKTK